MADPKILRVQDGNSLVVSVDGKETTFQLARTHKYLPDNELAKKYIGDMLIFEHQFDLSSDQIDIFITVCGERFNLSDRMIQLGLALPCS